MDEKCWNILNAQSHSYNGNITLIWHKCTIVFYSLNADYIIAQFVKAKKNLSPTVNKKYIYIIPLLILYVLVRKKRLITYNYILFCFFCTCVCICMHRVSHDDLKNVITFVVFNILDISKKIYLIDVGDTV